MSAYKVIQPQFKTLESLLKALRDVGLGGYELSAGPRQNTLALSGYGGARVSQKVAVRLPKSVYGGYEDVGFYWDEASRSYAALVSTHDSDYDGRRNIGEATLGKITQAYAFHEVSRQARLKGYSVKKTVEGDAIRVTLVRM